ncbi:MAG: ketoacyl-ACP synthase III [Deltaproteobacteria bacterium]|nr:ketoacyl-ACP synthase III [Deltaproteobacteria bacterium]
MAEDAKKPDSTILGTGHYLPSRVLSNADLEKMVDTSNEWIVERTGIRERRIAAADEAASDIASNAAIQALNMAEIDAKQLDLIIVATISPDMPLPATAMYVQQKIGARSYCPGFDLAAACAGFIYGLSVADSLIQANQAKYILVIGVELLSRILNYEDRATCVLFGDGGGAAVVGPSSGDGRGIISTHLYADGSQAKSLYIPAGGSRTPASEQTVRDKQHFVHMAGQDVFKFAVKSLSSAIQTAIRSSGLTPKDIDWVIPHQANIRIIDAVANRCNIPKERFYINIERVGNTSSASIPIALDEAVRNGLVRPGQNLLFCGLGAGITWGSALVRW